MLYLLGFIKYKYLNYLDRINYKSKIINVESFKYENKKQNILFYSADEIRKYYGITNLNGLL